MPLDTSIALNARLPQIESPLNQMANFASMRQAQQANALNELKMQETQRGMAENEAVRNYLASKNYDSPDFDTGLFAISPTQGTASMKTRAELAKERAQTGKVTAETEETKFKIVEKRLNILGQGFGAVRNNPTPETALRVLKYVRDNGAITPEQFEMYSADIMANPDPARIKQMADEGFTAALSAKDQLPQFFDQSNVMVNGVPTTRLLEVPSLGGSATTVKGSTGPTYNKPAASTVINMGGQPEFVKALGTNIGKDFAEEYTTEKKSAQSATENLPKLYETLNLINTSNAITGIGSEVLKNVERVKAQFLEDKKAGKKVSDTEVLDAMLGSDVFPMIQSLGIGARGMDTPAEREFLRGVMTGTTALDKNTLKRMTEIRVNLAERAIKKYNENVTSGKYAPVATALGSPIPTINAPQSTVSAPPMFAKNNQTGERIQSTDGGKTWTPVGAR